MHLDKKSKLPNQNPVSMKDSISSVGKYSLKETQFIQRINQPISAKLIKQFSNPSYRPLVEQKTKSLKIKKFQSLDTNTTEQFTMLAEQQKFIKSYKNDLFFRKKVDVLIKQQQKRMKQNQQIDNNVYKKGSLRSNTWRTQKQAQDQEVLQLYQRCKKWISKAQQTK